MAVDSSAVSPADSLVAPAGQAWLRDNNLASITQVLFSSQDEVSRADLADITGLTRATVSRLVDQLVAAGIAEKLPPVRLPQQGRPASPIKPAAGKVIGIGLEVNVDYIAGRAIDLSGRALSDFEIAGNYAGSNPEIVMDSLAEMASAMIGGLRSSGASIAGIGLAVPGIVASPGGHLLVAPNLKWTDVPLSEMLSSRLSHLGDIPLTVDNDANFQSALAAHLRPGLQTKDATFIYLVGDRGIGGAIVVDGVTNTGEHGLAGEIGHMCVDVNGPECFCGARGCLERFAGISALLANAGLDPQASTVGDLELLLEGGDKKALAAIETASSALSVALANTVNLLDISHIVLGTGLGRLLPWMEPGLSEAANAMIIGRAVRTVKIDAAASSPLPGCSGGAFVALQRVIDDPGAWIAGLDPAIVA